MERGCAAWPFLARGDEQQQQTRPRSTAGVGLRTHLRGLGTQAGPTDSLGQRGQRKE